jgi:hypothetical protein
MNWTEPKPPIKDTCFYDHVECDTPLGRCLITWKSWKKYPDYDVAIGGINIGHCSTLEESKQLAEKYLEIKALELDSFRRISHGG